MIHVSLGFRVTCSFLLLLILYVLFWQASFWRQISTGNVRKIVTWGIHTHKRIKKENKKTQLKQLLYTCMYRRDAFISKCQETPLSYNTRDSSYFLPPEKCKTISQLFLSYLQVHSHHPLKKERKQQTKPQNPLTSTLLLYYSIHQKFRS